MGVGALAFFYEAELVPYCLGLLQDVALLVAHKLWHQAVDDHQELNLVASSERLDYLDQPVLELDVKRCSSFLQELLWIRCICCLS